ncbi:hypothetical protein BCR36DRAFT_296723 [Piromyces finnis]|uniref:Uncharacterized protein n=1 Tax=Piromyces finnis TaxID=1754191 RepID=A0A1Y1V4B0_9FUNG|nr:hypothetical protein BCR36DRAFT_296723 [Piromyces finnis]|eukprot:ORX46939.1 hypothetical protein BCR36DRAFT_296723 [Piromyces finnis]
MYCVYVISKKKKKKIYCKAFLKNTDKNYKENNYFKREKILNQSVKVNDDINKQKERKTGSLINLMDNYDHDKVNDDDDDFLMSIEDFFKEQLKSSYKNKPLANSIESKETSSNSNKGNTNILNILTHKQKNNTNNINIHDSNSIIKYTETVNEKVNKISGKNKSSNKAENVNIKKKNFDILKDFKGDNKLDISKNLIVTKIPSSPILLSPKNKKDNFVISLDDDEKNKDNKVTSNFRLEKFKNNTKSNIPKSPIPLNQEKENLKNLFKEESDKENNDDILLIPFKKKKNVICISDDDDDDDDNSEDSEKLNHSTNRKYRNRVINSNEEIEEDDRGSDNELFSSEDDYDFEKEYDYESISSDDTYHPDSEGSCEELFEDEGIEESITHQDEIKNDIFEIKHHHPSNINSSLESQKPINNYNLYANKENISTLHYSSNTKTTQKSSDNILNWFSSKSNSVSHNKKDNNPIHSSISLNEVTININKFSNNTSINSPKSINSIPQNKKDLTKISDLNTFDPFSLPKQSSNTGLNPDFEEFLKRRGLTERYFGKEKSSVKRKSKSSLNTNRSRFSSNRSSTISNTTTSKYNKNYKNNFYKRSYYGRRKLGSKKTGVIKKMRTKYQTNNDKTTTNSSNNSSMKYELYNHYNDTPDFGDFARSGMGWEGLGHSYF